MTFGIGLEAAPLVAVLLPRKGDFFEARIPYWKGALLHLFHQHLLEVTSEKDKTLQRASSGGFFETGYMDMAFISRFIHRTYSSNHRY